MAIHSQSTISTCSSSTIADPAQDQEHLPRAPHDEETALHRKKSRITEVNGQWNDVGFHNSVDFTLINLALVALCTGQGTRWSGSTGEERHTAHFGVRKSYC